VGVLTAHNPIGLHGLLRSHVEKHGSPRRLHYIKLFLLDQRRGVVLRVTLRSGNFMKDVHLDRNIGQSIIQSRVLYANLCLGVRHVFKMF
jgi:hypothetical protein